MQSNGNRTSSLNEDIPSTDNTDVILFVIFILLLTVRIMIFMCLFLEYCWMSNGY